MSSAVKYFITSQSFPVAALVFKFSESEPVASLQDKPTRLSNDDLSLLLKRGRGPSVQIQP